MCRTSKFITVAALVCTVTGGSAWAQCPGTGVPFGADDTGLLTCDQTASKCEQKVAGNQSKLWQAILKCHIKMADAAVKGVATFELDEEACEAAAEQKFLVKTDVNACSCVDKLAIIAVAEGALDNTNSLTYCDPSGVPFAGDNTGNIPGTKDILKCEDGLTKCWAKYVKTFLKCHELAAKFFLKNTSFDEEACENGPLGGKAAIEVYQTCTAKVLSKGGCVGCENLPGVLALTDKQLDGGSFLSFCMP